MRKIRRSLRLAGAVMAIMWLLTDAVSAWYCRSFERKWIREAAIAKQGVAFRRMPVAPAEALAENAAGRYYAVFASLRRIPPETGGRLRQTTTLGFAADPTRAASLFGEACNDLPQLREALRCTTCVWELRDSQGDRGTFEHFTEVRLAADCLVLDAQRKAYEHDWRGAVGARLESLRFAGDLGQGDLLMNMAGVHVASESLRALGRLAALTRSSELGLEDVAEGLREFESAGPSLAKGFRLESPQLGGAIAIQERARMATLPALHGFPWHALSAWRLARNDITLEDLREASRQGNVKLWDASVGQLESRNGAVREGWPYLGAALSPFVDLNRLEGATLLAFTLREWHRQHGTYPRELTELPSRPASDSARYSQTDNGAGYKIWLGSGDTPLFEATP